MFTSSKGGVNIARLLPSVDYEYGSVRSVLENDGSNTAEQQSVKVVSGMSKKGESRLYSQVGIFG